MDDAKSAAQLAAEFRIAGRLDFTENETGLVKAMVSCGGSGGELYLQGAHVTAWTPAKGRPVIFTSPNSAFTHGKAIRGGIPVIFPWFGPNQAAPAAPQHGFARIAAWRLDEVAQSDGALTLRLSLAGEGDKFWPHRFSASYEISFGASLALRLCVRNQSLREIEFEEALHTYFAVSDVAGVSVAGLDGCQFIDKTDGMCRKRRGAGGLVLAGETDSVYLDTPARLAIADPAWRRRIAIAKDGAASAIVWNPWAEKSAAMADLGADVWRGMICVETGNVADDRVRLGAGAEHAMTTEIAVVAEP
jgi:glucose-6-phosphate 1-epimerase